MVNERSRGLLGRRQLRHRVAYSSRPCQCHLFCPCLQIMPNSLFPCCPPTTRSAVTIPTIDPLFRLKRGRLAEEGAGLTTQHTFQLSRRRDGAPALPKPLLPFLWLALARSPEQVAAVEFEGEAGAAPEESIEKIALSLLSRRLRERLGRYRSTVEEDDAAIASGGLGARRLVATRLLRLEKLILVDALDQVDERGRAVGLTPDSDDLGSHSVELD